MYGKTMQTNWDSNLSIVIPARNEAATIESLLMEFRNEFPTAQLIVVDNGSTDGTGELARGLMETLGNLLVVEEAKPGKGNAMRKGAYEASKHIIMFHDADSEYCIQDARDVADAVLSYEYGPDRIMSIGVRAWRLSWLPVVSFAVNFLVRAILTLRHGDAPEDVLTGTRCMSRKAFLAMETVSETFAIETEISRKAILEHISVVELSVRYTPRTRKEGKKIGWRHLFPILIEAFRKSERESFQHTPISTSIEGRSRV